MYWLKSNCISQNMIQRYLSLPTLAAAKRFVFQALFFSDLWESPLINKNFISRFLFFPSRPHYILHIFTHMTAGHFGSLSLACLFC